MSRFYKDNFDFIFLAIAFADLLCVATLPEGRIVTKPLIMIALVGYYYLTSRNIDWLFFTALIFAFLGDVLLLFDGFFLFGLGAFLVMQVVYAICFFKQIGSITISRLIGVASIGFLTTLTLLKLLPSLDQEMKIPVIIYSSAIGLMAISAMIRENRNGEYWLILLGVISFLISDSILGWNKFAGDLPYAGLLIMATYMLAQYLIVKGYLKHTIGNNTAN